MESTFKKKEIKLHSVCTGVMGELRKNYVELQ